MQENKAKKVRFSIISKLSNDINQSSVNKPLFTNFLFDYLTFQNYHNKEIKYNNANAKNHTNIKCKVCANNKIRSSDA